jgi:regulator of protease activity HflC (stomatin/prohibitin superfamily)
MGKRFGKTESYKLKQYIFILVFIILVVVVWLAYTRADDLAVYAAVLFSFLILAFLIRQYDFLLTLKEYERAVIFTFGRVTRVGGPGWTFVIPAVQSFVLVDLRTQTIDIPPQEVITTDKIKLTIDAVIYLFVDKTKDSVINSVIEIDDYRTATRLYVRATIRDVVGSMDLSSVISNIALLNAEVKRKLEEVAKEWGVKVESVEITNVVIPPEVLDAMHNQKAAEQRKLAKFEEAEGKKYEIEAIKAASGELTDKTIAYYYINALEKIAEGQSSKIIFPMELTNFVKSFSNESGGLDLKKLGVTPEMIDAYLKMKKKEKMTKKTDD